MRVKQTWTKNDEAWNDLSSPIQSAVISSIN